MDKEAFQIIVMGCCGGPRETNISGYLLSPLEENQWIALDAGSLLSGIEAAIEKGNLNHLPFSSEKYIPAGEMLIDQIRAYLISHAHIDHIAGMVLNSQNDSSKVILGIDPTIDNLRDHVFNGRVWPNYGNEGVEPRIGRYNYVRLPFHDSVAIPKTSMTVEAYLLSHPHGYPSTAFLVEYKKKYILYFGDTSPDSLEVEKHLARIWRRIAPLIQERTLHGILLECSYPHADADQTIYGHLDTRLMLREFHHLSSIANAPLTGLNVIVTHRKESLKKGFNALQRIEQELTRDNNLGINFLFPTQGARYVL